MKVIVASYSKCGTKTMAVALRQLGYVVYDFMENYENLGDKWIAIMEQGTTPEELRSLYEGVDAVTDVPCAIFWEELLQAFPDAKIIFSRRDTEDDWARSLRHQHEALMDKFKIPMLVSKTARKFKFYLDRWSCTDYGSSHVTRALFGKTRFNELSGRRAYRLHNSYLIMHAPPQQLLEFNLCQGWAPLCHFLDKKVPDVPFPHKNKNASMTTINPSEDDNCQGGRMTALKISQETTYVIIIVITLIIISILLPCFFTFVNFNR